MKIKTTQWAASLGLLGLAWTTAVACGSTHDQSLVEPQGGSSTGASSSGGTHNGSAGTLILNSGGEDGLGNNSGGENNNGTGGAGCGSTHVAADPPLVNVLIVVDKSLSMNDKPTGFAVDKWTALHTALTSALDQTKDKISYGLEIYPYSGKTGGALDKQCQMPAGDASVVVPVDEGATTAPLILKALDDNPPAGQTPTAIALAHADAYFTSGGGKGLKGERYVLLATDGGPNCSQTIKSCTIDTCTVNMDGKSCGGPDINCCDKSIPEGTTTCLDEADSVAAVATLAKHGIKTFVVGIPGTEAYAATLDALAAKSGVTNPDAPPKYFAVDAKKGAAGLGDVLSTITTGLVTSCKLQLEEVPPVLNDVYVVVGNDRGGTALEQNDADGWVYDMSVSPPAIVIQGKACDELEANGAPYINVSYGCPDFDPPK
ncbi:MAG TPA: vWA domain-containing protein [Polyangiaceae bacterium]|nr:vWA domain-containing protein [Polyangiaceae bacterium]